MTDDVTPSSIIYVLTNDAMPTMVKIGRTSGEGVERRVAELGRATGVPLPFKVAVARLVHDAVIIERALHIAFAPDRVNPAREFFSIEASRVVALINSYPGVDLTPQTEKAVEREVENAEPGTLAAVRRYERKRRPAQNFFEMNIPLGEPLVHSATGEVAIIAGPRKVIFRGEEMSLTKALRTITGAPHDVQPAPSWTYNGESLQAIYDRTYPRLSDDD